MEVSINGAVYFSPYCRGRALLLMEPRHPKYLCIPLKTLCNPYGPLHGALTFGNPPSPPGIPQGGVASPIRRKPACGRTAIGSPGPPVQREGCGLGFRVQGLGLRLQI